MKNNKKIAIIVIGIFISLITAIIFSTKSVKKVDNIAQITDIETLMAIEYGELSADENKTESEYVEFSAFFTKNIDEDEYAERVRGTCKEIGAEDTLYLELNVLTQGYLKNGKITLNADNNFTWTTAIVDDNSIVDGDYIGETATIKLKDEVQNGSQKLFWGTISDKIGNNINNYSKVNSVILTGTYVDEDGNETPINKTVNVTVDWYGETTTEVNKHYYNEVNYTSYASQNYDIANLIRDDKAVVSFKVAVSEIAKELLLQKQMLEIEIPELNGYAATQVKVTDKNVSYEYNAETRILTITRETQTDETGEVTNELARSNVNTVEVT